MNNNNNFSNKLAVVNDRSIMKMIMSFHINTEKEKNKRKYDKVVKSIKLLNFFKQKGVIYKEIIEKLYLDLIIGKDLQ